MNERVSDPFFRRKLLLLGCAPIVLHVLIWCVVIARRDLDPGVAMLGLDSGWYAHIVDEGYSTAQSAAFYPLYPLFVKLVSDVSNLVPLVAGILLSVTCYVVSLNVLARSLEKYPHQMRQIGISQSLFPFFLFVFSPASYVFHTLHTEALFLLLSLLAFVLLSRQRLLTAAFFAGLSALCKNQGVFVAIAVAAGTWSAPTGGLKAFLKVTAISALTWLLVPIFFALELNDPLASFKAQSFWAHASSPIEVLKSFALMNPWQNHSSGSILRLLCYLAVLPLVPHIWCRNRALGVYTALSLSVMPLQGEYVTVFRFFSFLFPLYFALGEVLEKKSSLLKVATGAVFFTLNAMCAYAFISGKWAY